MYEEGHFKRKLMHVRECILHKYRAHKYRRAQSDDRTLSVKIRVSLLYDLLIRLNIGHGSGIKQIILFLRFHFSAPTSPLLLR